MAEFIKVPFYVEEDGSKTFFLPDCRHKVGYEIGPRGAGKEKYIQTYWEALDKLMKLPEPRFRRKNKNGNSGTVKCRIGDVEEISREFIESERMKHGG